MLIMKGMKFSNLPTSLHSDIAHLREASGPGETQQGSFYFFGEREKGNSQNWSVRNARFDRMISHLIMEVIFSISG